MKKTKLFPLACTAVLAATAMIPFAFAADNDRLVISQATNAAVQVQQSAPAAAQAQKGFMSREKAIELALKETPGVLKSIEFDVNDAGYLYYDAEVHYNNKEYDLKFDAIDGTIYKNKQDSIDWEDAIPAGSYLTYAQAAEAAAKEVGGGFVSKLELVSRKTGVVYEAQIWLGDYEYDVILSANDGEVLAAFSEWDASAAYYNKNLSGAPVSTTPPTASSSAPAAQKPAQTANQSITMQQAQDIALKQAPGGRVTDVDFDYEHGFSVYEIEVREGFWEYDFVIDAATGEILKSEKDFDD